MAAEPVASASTVLDHNDAYSTLEQLKIKDSEELKKYMETMELSPSSFSRLRILEARKCDQELTKFLSILLHQSPELEELIVENCEMLEQVLNLGHLAPDEQEPPLFRNFRKMRLCNLPMLNCICNNDVKFGNLVQLLIFKCGFLKGPLPTTLLAKLDVLKIQSCEMIEQVIEENVEMQESLFPNLRFLVLTSLPKLTKFNSGRCHLTFPKLEGARIEKCPELNAFCQAMNTALLDTLKLLRFIGMPGILFLTLSNSGSLLEFSLRNLELMEIKDCNDLQYVFAIKGLTTRKNKGGLLFPALRQLGLRNLRGLRGIVKQDSLGRTLSFEMLTHLTVCSCNQLRYVLPLHVLQSLGKLQNIEISDCEMLERVFGEEDDTQMRKSDNIVHQLPQVKSLTLQRLPKFRRCCQDGCTIEWFSFKRVKVVECPMIQKSSLGKIDRQLLKSVEVIECNTWANNEDPESHIEYLFELTDELSRREKLKIEDSEELTKCMEIMEPRPFVFSRMKILEARQCDQELTKFLSILLRRSHGLEELTVESCKLLEQVFNIEDLAPDKQVPRILFNNLKRMTLCDLPMLNCISNNDVKLGNLVQLVIFKCGFLKGPLPTTLLAKLNVLKIQSCEMIEQVIEENVEMQESLFPKLRFLVLASLPKLTKFNSARCHLTFPELEGGWIEKCPELNAFSQALNTALLDTLKRLRFIGMPGILFLTLSNSGSLLKFSLRNLELMEIKDCNDLQYVFAIKGLTTRRNKGGLLFPALRQLGLRNLRGLRGIVKQDSLGRTLSFEMLTHLTVCSCNQLRYVLPLHVLQSLGKLQNIEISDCEMLERVFGEEDGTQMRKSENIVHQMPQVKSLTLEKLPKFSWYCQNGSTVEWLSLERVRVVKCDMIQKSSLGMIDRPLLTSLEVIDCNTWANNEDPGSHIDYLFELTDAQLKIKDSEELRKCMEIMELMPFIFSRLKILEARQCDQELTNFLSILLRRSHRLEELTVENCKLLEQVFNLEDLTPDKQDYTQAVSVPFGHDKTISLPRLRVLELSNLPKVQLWNEEPQIPVFEKMTSLKIIGCGSIKKLFSISVAKHLYSLKLLTLYKCENMIQVLHQGGRETGKQVFEKLETLVLKHLPRLTSFCEEYVDFGEFPQLKMIRVENVPNMNTFVKQPLKTPKLKQVHVTFIRKCWLGNLNKTITFLHEIQDQLKEKVWESNQSNNTSYEAESSSQGKFDI